MKRAFRYVINLPNTWLISHLVLISMVVTYAIFAIVTPKSPVLWVYPKQAQLVFPGAPHEFTFTLANRGGDDLHIKHIETDCGCTVVSLPKMVLGPGERQPMKVTAAPPRGGRRTVHYTVESNCSREPVRILQLRVEDRTAPPFILEGPPSVVIRDTGEGPAEWRFLVEAIERTNSAKWLKGAEALDCPINISIESIKESPYFEGPHIRRTYSFVVRVNNEAAHGKWLRSINLVHEGKDPVTTRPIPMVLDRPGEIYLEPATVYFSLTQQRAAEHEALLWLRSRSHTDQQWELGSVECNLQGLQTKQPHDKPGVVIVNYRQPQNAENVHVLQTTISLVLKQPDEFVQLDVPLVVIPSYPD